LRLASKPFILAALPPRYEAIPLQISLVIPAHSEEAYIGGCLDSVLANAAGRFHEIIVIDNASSDRTAEVAAARPGVRVVTEPAKGLTRARQRGYLEATGEYVAYIDADTRMPPGWFDRVERTFAAHPDAVSLSGPAKYWDANAWQRFALSVVWWLSAPIAYRVVGYMVYGAHFVVRRSALDAIGGFDHGIEFYGEDTDLARRLHPLGKVIFDMRFVIQSSARRFKKEGMFRTTFVYSLNFLWPALFGRPFTTSHTDVRPTLP
jgi:glycosyltransferase involved in cell wall biosynthesis